MAAFDGCLLSQEDFVARMRQDRLRSERNGSPVSLLVIDLQQLLVSSAAGNRNDQSGFIRHIGHVLGKFIRETDTKGWLRNGKIGVLALDTDEAGARAMADNLIRKITSYQDWNDYLGADDIKRCLLISSLDTDRNYFQVLDNLQEDILRHHKTYRVEFSSPSPDTRFLPSGQASAGAAVAEWPFSMEVLNQYQRKRLQFAAKRLLDVVGSLIGIVVCAPLMLTIAAVIRMTSPGPALFRQERLGLLGKKFMFLKFRSMRVDTDPSIHKEYVCKLIKGETDQINKGTADRPVFKITDDPRVTTVGKFLRITSLDELPQLFNVLRGDMSLVGPRPHIDYECNQYKPWHCRRVLEVKPGITGLWQVSGRSSTNFDDAVRLDLAYVRNWNLWLDIKIILKTFRAVISTKGAY